MGSGKFTRELIFLMDKSKLLRLVNFFSYILIVGTPLFYLKKSVYPYTFSKTLFFQAVVEIIFFLWLILVFLDKKYRPKLNSFGWGVLVFLGALLLASVLGEDFARSFWSTQERNLGVFSFLHLGAIFFVFSSLGGDLPWKKFFYSSLITSMVVVSIAFIQLEQPNLLLNEPIGGRPGATFGNPTFLAGYLVFQFFLALYYLLNNFEKKFKLGHHGDSFFENVFLVLSLLFSVAGLFLTQTRGDILGLVFGVLAVLIFLAFKPFKFPGIWGRRNFYVWILAALLAFGSVFWLTRGAEIWSYVPGLSRFRDVSLSDQGLQPRLIAIKAAWEGFKEKPILGWGFENFNLVYNKHYDPDALELGYQETRFDKPHNLFFEILVTGGLVLFFGFVFVIATFVFYLFKQRDDFWKKIGLGVITAYLVRSFFVFDTIGPILMLYLFMSFTSVLVLVEFHKNKEVGSREKRFNPWILSFLAVLVLVVVYSLNIKPMVAANDQFWGFNYFVQNKPNLAIEKFSKAIEAPTPYSYYFKRDYATALAETYFYRPETIDKEAVVAAIEKMEAVTREHPKDAYNHYVLVDLYNQVSSIDPERFLAAAEREAAIALELSPNRQQVLFSLSKTKHLQGKKEEALEILEKAISLNPNIADAHFYYGLLAYDFGKIDLGYQELQKSIELGRRWKNFHEPLVVGNFFADSGHIDEAIELYRVAEEMEPTDLEVKMKLGIAYYFNNQKDLAREKILEVMTKFDITDSEAYEEIFPILRDLGLVN